MDGSMFGTSNRTTNLVGRTHTIVRLQTGNRRKDHGTENFGGFVYVLDRFPQLDLGLWVFMCPTNNTLFLSLFRVSLSGYHAEGYHAPPLPPRAITPVYTSRLSHQSYHAPPRKYIGLSHPLFCLLYTSPSPRDLSTSRMPSSA